LFEKNDSEGEQDFVSGGVVLDGGGQAAVDCLLVFFNKFARNEDEEGQLEESSASEGEGGEVSSFFFPDIKFNNN